MARECSVCGAPALPNSVWCIVCKTAAADYQQEIANGACRRCGGYNDTDYEAGITDDGAFVLLHRDCGHCDGTGFEREPKRVLAEVQHD